MKVVALISGGKDSCFNMMHCVKQGHEIVALANLKPVKTDEMDSYMYQTVGHHVIDLYAEAIGLPLFRRDITGTSLCQDAVYRESSGDEVEDLYELLKGIRETVEYDAVASGAILSNYQRVRVENVCSRLGIQSLAYLWQRDQVELLEEIISADLKAVLIKVATLGLEPKKHLGKSLQDMQPHLLKMKEKFHLNVCGEGGEYETMTLDCPLFVKKIVIDEQEIVIHSDDAFAPVGYLSFKKMHLEPKAGNPHSTLTERIQNCTIPIPNLFRHDTIDFHHSKFKLKSEQSILDKHSIELGKIDHSECFSNPQFFSSSGMAWVTELKCPMEDGSNIEDAAEKTMKRLKSIVTSNGFDMNEVTLVHLFCSNMNDFARINAVYKKYFFQNPPARVCVEVPLPASTIFKLDVCLHNATFIRRDTLHVQSISYWAPANIGPYSQAVKVGSDICFSGSIGMQPSSMAVITDGFEQEAFFSLHHVNEVSKVIIPERNTFKDYGCVTCYIVDETNFTCVEEIFRHQNMFEPSRYILHMVCVPQLPRNAAVEWHILTRISPERTVNLDIDSEATITAVDSFQQNNGFFQLLIPETEIQHISASLSDILHNKVSEHYHQIKLASFLRVFYIDTGVKEENHFKTVFHKSLKTSNNDKGISFVPVSALPNNNLILIAGHLSPQQKHDACRDS